MENPSPLSKRQKIEAAFERLVRLPGTEIWQNLAVASLLEVDTSGPGTRPVKFMSTSDKITLSELEKLQRLSEQLAHHIETMHEPAIVAMMGWRTRLTLPTSLRDTAQIAKNAIDAINQQKVEETTTEPTNQDLPGRSSVPARLHDGRPENIRALAICQLLAYYYFSMTGNRPTLRRHADGNSASLYGPFFTLVEDIFDALELDESCEHFAKKAIQSFVIEKTPSEEAN